MTRGLSTPPDDPMARAHRAGRVILVEGVSDAVALETLAAIEGIDLSGTAILPVHGAHAIGPGLARFGPRGTNTLAGGLCDAAEAGFLRTGLRRAGFDTVPPEGALARHGFHVCDRDLEDELLRALGIEAARAVVEAAGDGPALAAFRDRARWRGRGGADQLRGFLAAGAGRKIRYARLLVEAIPRGHHPAPLRAVLGRGGGVVAGGPAR